MVHSLHDARALNFCVGSFGMTLYSEQLYQPSSGCSGASSGDARDSTQRAAELSFWQPLTQFQGDFQLVSGARAYAKGKKGKAQGAFIV
jgi:hypothetical protein